MKTRTLLIAVCLLLTAGVLARANRAEPTPTRAPLRTCPLVISDYRGRDLEALDERTLSLLGTNEYLNRLYSAPAGAPVSLYVGYYATQRTGATIHSPQNCLPGAGWDPVEAGRAQLLVRSAEPTSSTRAIEVNRYIIQKGLDRQLVLYWYQSHDRIIASEYWAKAYLMLDAVRMNRTDGALVRVITPITGSEAAADREAGSFVQQLFPLLSKYLPS